MHYMWYDTETGGLNYKVNPVLTIYFALCNDKQEQFAELSLKVKPDNHDDPNWVCEQQALKVNGIDIEKHMADPETLTYSEAKPVIVKFFEDNKIARKRKWLQPCGHNIPFDDNFLEHQILGADFQKYFHHRKLDTSSITTFLKDVGMLPETVGSLTSLVEHFKIPMGEAHTAKDDVQMNIKVYRDGIKKMLSDKKQGMAGIDKNLLSIVEL